MNILFITLLNIQSIDNHDLYTDLMRQFAKNDHSVYIISPTERRFGKQTELLEDHSDELDKRVHILKLKTGNIQKTNIIEKGISTILLGSQLQKGIKQYFSDVHFDLVLYSTPPITVLNTVKFIKKRDRAKTYLMLKDIFPQNAVDIGMMSKTGLKGVLYKYFRSRERKLYAVSDRIGCMSQANADYVLKHNPEIDPGKVEICPNSIEVQDVSLTPEERISMRNKYEIPIDKKAFVYGGNLGKPQGISFIMRCLQVLAEEKEVFFLIAGDGTEFGTIESFISKEKLLNVKLMKSIPREDYDRMIAACDVGLVFLDHRFTIPNYPSRLLAYMQAGLPVLAATDPNTDVGQTIVEGNFGWWCESNNPDDFAKCVLDALHADLQVLGRNSKKYLEDNFTAKKCFNTISKHFKQI